MGSPPDEAAVPDLDYLAPGALAHPQAVFRETLRTCPVKRVFPGTGHFVFRYDDVMYALKHPEIFSAQVETGMLGNDRPLIPLQIDPPEQTRYRKLLDPFFLRRRVAEMEPDVRRLVNQLIDAFIDRGECEFQSEFAIPLPCTVFLRLFGLPADDLALFLELKDGIIRPRAETFQEVAAVRDRTARRLYDYFDARLDDRRAHPRDDLLSYLVTVEQDGVALTREEVLDICFLFLIAGLDTVTATLGCSFAYLARHPDRRRQLLDHPELLGHAVEELLRWETPVTQVVRLVTRDAELGGVTLERGERITLVLGAANVDPRQFETPDEVDFRRTANRHLAFGGGAHRCMGSHLARMELEVSLAEFHARIPEYRVREGVEPAYTPAIREVPYLPLVFGPLASGPGE